MASDRGAARELRGGDLDAEWLACDHLHISGYALMLEPVRSAALRAVELARAGGAQISVDLASWSAIRSSGEGEFSEAVRAMSPDGPADLDAIGGELRPRKIARVVRARLSDESRLLSESCDPGRNVGRLASRPDTDLGVGVAACGHRSAQADDDVEGQVSKGANEHREGDRKIRAWTAASGGAGFAPSSWEGWSAHPRPLRR